MIHLFKILTIFILVCFPAKQLFVYLQMFVWNEIVCYLTSKNDLTFFYGVFFSCICSDFVITPTSNSLSEKQKFSQLYRQSCIDNALELIVFLCLVATLCMLVLIFENCKCPVMRTRCFYLTKYFLFLSDGPMLLCLEESCAWG